MPNAPFGGGTTVHGLWSIAIGKTRMKTSMTRYVAFLRGVSPMNLRMPALKECLKAAGFKNVKTLLSSGNAVFDAAAYRADDIAHRCEAAMKKHPGKSFLTIVRAQEELKELIKADPFAAYRIPEDAKRIATFLPSPLQNKVALPGKVNGARILGVRGGEVLSIYRPTPKGPAFMRLIEKTFGAQVTTRTWDTVTKCAKA